ncbi:MAG TPA: hypothetical protein ENN67_04575, partial [Firmicutes bacterium]|nr:hypothetical protein [Bacillota bacterium]
MKIESLLLSLIVFFILAVGSPVLSEEADSESSAEPLNRMDLLVPDKIWSRVLENSGCPNGVLGYTSDEMSYFKSSSCILPGIERLFRDVKNVPRFSGRIGNLLMENPSDFAWAATIGFSLLEGRAGAGVTPPSGNEWGLEYIDSLGDGDEGVELHEAFDAFMRSSRSYMPGQYNFHEIPEPVLRLILRILIAADKSKPVINQAWDENLYIQYF